MIETGQNEESNAADFFSLKLIKETKEMYVCLLYTSPSPRDNRVSRMPSSA